MKVEILDEALDDLVAGHHFYERQGIGLGAYFIDSIWSDIESLYLYAACGGIVARGQCSGKKVSFSYS